MTKFPVLDEGYFGNSSSSSTQSQEVQPEKPQQNPPPLDERCFSSFAPLIEACQDYATLSGCRFSIRAFDGIDCEPGARLPIVSDKRAQDAGPLLSAKLQAVSSVRSFAKRIRSGELDLIQDLTRAFDIVTQESARNSMIASCKAADVFPPLEHTHVDEQDCSWDAVGATSVLVIAQRSASDAYRPHRHVGAIPAGSHHLDCRTKSVGAQSSDLCFSSKHRRLGRQHGEERKAKGSLLGHSCSLIRGSWSGCPRWCQYRPLVS